MIPADLNAHYRRQIGGMIMVRKRRRQWLWMLLVIIVTAFFAGTASADMAAAKKWVDSEFQPSTLSKKEQLKEMEFFINAAKPFKGLSTRLCLSCRSLVYCLIQSYVFRANLYETVQLIQRRIHTDAEDARLRRTYIKVITCNISEMHA